MLKHGPGLTLMSLLSLLQVACSSQPYSEIAIKPIRLQQHVQQSWQQSHRFFIGFPSPQAFSVCHDLSCHSVSDLSLTDSEWRQISTLFTPVADSPRAERQQIASAVAVMEKLVGNKTGTAGDRGQNELPGSRQGQLDCIDEATNTSVYLRMMESEGLLHWHQSAPRTSRGLLIGRAPHNTASIIDTQSQQRFAVDSWFFANGQPPAIVLMADWKKGWRPASLEN